MTFHTMFDAGTQGFAWWYGVNGLVIFAVGAFFVLQPDITQRLLPKGLQGVARRIFSWGFMLAGLMFAVVVLSSTYREYAFAKDTLNSGRFSVVEGPVTNFEPMPASGHGKEGFNVKGRHFSYSDFIETAGFHQTNYRSGPIHEGLYVRITYVGNMILRLEVRQ